MICAAATMTAFASGCTVAASDAAICAGTAGDRTAHARALVQDGGPQSRRTGALLIAKVDAGCAS